MLWSAALRVIVSMAMTPISTLVPCRVISRMECGSTSPAVDCGRFLRVGSMGRGARGTRFPYGAGYSDVSGGRGRAGAQARGPVLDERGRVVVDVPHQCSMRASRDP